MNLVDRIKPVLKRHWVTLLLVALVAYIWFRPPARVSELNEALPSLPFTTLDGRTGNLQNLRGKVVLINFWATWCPYCLKEMPAIGSFYKDYQARGVEVLALSLDDDPAKAAAFMHEHQYPFPAAMASAEFRQALGPVDQVPMSMIIDKAGVLRYKVHGQVYYGRLEDLIQPLLGAAQP